MSTPIAEKRTTRGDSLARRLRVRYVIGLAAILTILTVAQFIVHDEVAAQEADARVINAAGRQRMLSQKCAKAAQALALDAGTGAQSAGHHADELASALAELESAHHDLWKGSNAEGLPPAPEPIAEMFVSLDPTLLALSSGCRDVLRLTEAGVASDRGELSEAIVRIQRAESRFLSEMNTIVGAFQLDSEAKLAATIRTKLALYILTILVLLVEVVLVFEPAVRAVGRRVSGLADARVAAEQLARARSDFLANMSHEIRTPMTAIIGYAELMTDADQTRSDRLNAAQVIQRQGHHLLGIINDILDAAKLDAGKIDIKTEPAHLLGVISEARDLFRHRAEQAGLDLQLELEAPLPRLIDTDPLRLRQVMVNLLGNALKFTEKGKITIAAEAPGPRQVRIGIFDTGPGLGEDESKLLFMPFAQSDSSATRRHGGTGLGLSISRRLAALLGGELSHEPNPGGGSRFWFTVPADLDSEPLLTTDKQIQDELALVHRVAEEQKPTSGLEGLEILLAEDGIDNQRLIGHFLERAGAHVFVVDNGREAVDIAFDRAFDVILMDMQMPVLDGYSAATELRSKGYEGPVIALTAHTMVGDREKCLDAGCSGFMSKPVDRRKLIEVCRTHGRAARRLRNSA